MRDNTRFINIQESHEVSAFCLLEEAVAESERYLASINENVEETEINGMFVHANEVRSQILNWKEKSGYSELNPLIANIDAIVAELGIKLAEVSKEKNTAEMEM